MTQTNDFSDHVATNHIDAKVHDISVHFSENRQIPFPPVGLCRTDTASPIEAVKLDLLKQASFTFYQVKVELFRNEWSERFRMANTEAKKLKIPMQVCLVFGDNADDELETFIELCNSVFPFIDEVIVLRRNCEVTPSGLLPGILSSLREGLHHVKIGVGTLDEFDALEHDPPAMAGAGFLTFSVHGQIPAHRSVSSIMSAALTLAAGQEVYVCAFSGAGNEESHANLTQNTAGIIHLINALIEGGAASLCAGETIGAGGMFDTEESGPSAVYFLLREILSMNKGFMLVSEIEPASEAGIIGLKSGSQYKLILVNPTAETMNFHIDGIPGIHTARLLSPVGMIKLADNPELFGQSERKAIVMDNNSLKFALDSFNIAILES